MLKRLRENEMSETRNVTLSAQYLYGPITVKQIIDGNLVKRFKVQGSFISHYLYKVNMESKVRLQHMITR